MILTDNDKETYTGAGYHIYRGPAEIYNRKYVGDYIDGKEHGIGMYQAQGGGHKYAGEFKDDNINGIGIKTRYNGVENYCGEWKDNLYDGMGYIKLFSGASFIGNFKKELPYGSGLLTTWEKFKFIGEINVTEFGQYPVFAFRIWQTKNGTWYDNHNEIDITTLGYYKDGSKYIGEFKNGLFDGQGILIFVDGTKYEGEWKNGLMHGQGDLKSGGNKHDYTGQWQYGKLHGFGKQTFQSGTNYEGEFKNNMWHGQGTYTNLIGHTFTGAWKNGYFGDSNKSIRNL